jgi:hypothetical protein
MKPMFGSQKDLSLGKSLSPLKSRISTYNGNYLTQLQRIAIVIRDVINKIFKTMISKR